VPRPVVEIGQRTLDLGLAAGDADANAGEHVVHEDVVDVILADEIADEDTLLRRARCVLRPAPARRPAVADGRTLARMRPRPLRLLLHRGRLLLLLEPLRLPFPPQRLGLLGSRALALRLVAERLVRDRSDRRALFRRVHERRGRRAVRVKRERAVGRPSIALRR